jgi:hypothetical protein
MNTFTARIAAVVLLIGAVPAAGFAQERSWFGGKPALKPGAVRITTRNPLPGNWVCQASGCYCKELACGEAAHVTYSSAPTPARQPDPKALEKFAKIEMPKRVTAANAAQQVLSEGKTKVSFLSSKVTTHLGYPSVLSETKVATEKGTGFVIYAMVFIGPVLVTIKSTSKDRAVAMNSLNAYVETMSVEEGPSVAPNAQPSTPPERDDKV